MSDLKVKLKKPITIGSGEGQEIIDTIDLSGLENLTGADVLICEKEADRKGGQANIYGPVDAQFQLEMAARVSGRSAEILTKLHPRDFHKVRQAVRDFLIASDSE